MHVYVVLHTYSVHRSCDHSPLYPLKDVFYSGVSFEDASMVACFHLYIGLVSADSAVL